MKKKLRCLQIEPREKVKIARKLLKKGYSFKEITKIIKEKES